MNTNEENRASTEIEAGALEDQTHRLNEKLAAMKAAGRTVKRTGRLMAVLVAVVAIGGVYVLLYPLLPAYYNLEPYKQAFRTEVEKQILPVLETESVTLFNAVAPDILQAIQQKVPGRLPEIAVKLEQEGQLLVKELSDEAQARFTGRSEKMLNRLERSLAKEIPQITDPDNADLILANMHTVTQNAFDRFTQTYLKDHINTVTNLHSRIETFPVPKRIQEMSDDQLSEYLTQTLGTYVTVQLVAIQSPEMKEFMQSLESPQTIEGK
jgi:hypothetical protein